jgi:hypothetical protein
MRTAGVDAPAAEELAPVPDDPEPLNSATDTGELASVADSGDLEMVPDAEPASSATESTRPRRRPTGLRSRSTIS